jgi:hypothetical protein
MQQLRARVVKLITSQIAALKEEAKMTSIGLYKPEH